MIKITVDIDGMSCGMCESHVNGTIREKLPVKKVSSSHTKGQAVIIAQEDIADEKIKEVLDPTGYKFLSAEREPYEKRGLFGRK